MVTRKLERGPKIYKKKSFTDGFNLMYEKNYFVSQVLSSVMVEQKSFRESLTHYS